MIELRKVKYDSGEDGNSIILNLQVELTEEDAQSYIELDEVLSNPEYKKDEHIQDVFGDIMSDYGLFYYDGILGSTNWSVMEQALTELHEVLTAAKEAGII